MCIHQSYRDDHLSSRLRNRGLENFIECHRASDTKMANPDSHVIAATILTKSKNSRFMAISLSTQAEMQMCSGHLGFESCAADGNHHPSLDRSKTEKLISPNYPIGKILESCSMTLTLQCEACQVRLMLTTDAPPPFTLLMSMS